jgi:glutamine synthetase
VSVAPAELESAFEEGIGFDGSAIEGFARVYESDMVAMPDPTTFQVFPFEGGVSGESARMFCDILLPDGSAAWADPRHVLRRMLSKAAEKGFTFYTHPEIEFFLLQDGPLDGGSVPIPVDTGGYFDHTTHAVARDFRRRPCSRWSGSASRSSSATTRSRPGQQEIDLRYADALTTADNIMTFRHVVKEVALSQGVRATFMPKPFTDQPGSGMHTHLSLFEGERNAFYDGDDPLKLSKTARAFIAGLLVHARETPRSPTSG